VGLLEGLIQKEVAVRGQVVVRPVADLSLLRSLPEEDEKLLLNNYLLRINQDDEGRNVYGI
jgi:hypothetical protein